MFCLVQIQNISNGGIRGSSGGGGGGGSWILTGGTWHDSGVWIDGSVWID